MTAPTPRLEESYRARALPQGSARYFSHLFAAATVKPALLGLYALSAEWQALTEPATERAVAEAKLAWWQEELARLRAGSALHPICRYLLSLPHAQGALFEPLETTLAATWLELGGVPLERGAELAGHAAALFGLPLRIAATIAGHEPAGPVLQALACARYIGRSLANYRRAAGQGKIVFPVDELLSAGIENAALAAKAPSPELDRYLGGLRARARAHYDAAHAALPPSARAPQRHLLVLGALGRARLDRAADAKRTPLRDMLLAWSTARRAARMTGE